MARSFSQEPRSDSHKIGETRYRMSHLPSTTAIARTLLLAGILLAVTVLAARSFLPAFAQDEPEEIEFFENSEEDVAVFTVSDPDGDSITWSVIGTDAPDFSVAGDSAGATLKFEKSPNFEAPTDRDDQDNDPDIDANDNMYHVTVAAFDGTATSSTEVIVTVMNVEEDGEVTMSAVQPKELVELVASLTDPDGEVRDTSSTPEPNGTDLTTQLDANDDPITKWQWASSTKPNADWQDIETATTNRYIPTEADVDGYLRVTVTYMDGSGVDDPDTFDVDESQDDPIIFYFGTAPDFDDRPVLMDEYENTPPAFKNADGEVLETAIRKVPENSTEGTDVGKPVQATDLGENRSEQTLTYTLEEGNADLFTIENDNPSTRSVNEGGQIKVGADANLDRTDTSGNDGIEDDLSYTFMVRATDPSGTSTTIAVTVEVTNVNEGPTISDTDGPSTNTVAENIATTEPLNSTAYTASDPEDDELTWTAEGLDGALFNITNGQLMFKASPDYEDPKDKASTPHVAKDNTYSITLKVSDEGGLSDTRDVVVVVTNVDEGNDTITLTSHFKPAVNTNLTASFEDDDAQKSTIVWTWATSTGNLATTTNSFTSTYQPKVAVEDQVLTVTVSYYDRAMSARHTFDLNTQTVLGRPATANSAPVFTTDPVNRTVAENAGGANVGAPVTATDDAQHSSFLRYGLETPETGDERFFNIDPTTGQITVRPAAGLDREAQETYDIVVRATDPFLSVGKKSVKITATNVPEPPTITVVEHATITVVNDSSINVEYAEDRTDAVVDLDATDPEDDKDDLDLTWNVPANSEYEISSDGVLTFKDAPNFEESGNTPIAVRVTVTDSVNTSDTLDVSVTVNDVEEAGTITLPNLQPKETIQYVATLTDPDGAPGQIAGSSVDTDLTGEPVVTWQWARKGPRETNWTDIGMATTSSYTPVKDDVGKFLRLTAKYTDRRSEPGDDPKMAEAMTTNIVLMKDYVNAPPKFPDQDPATDGDQLDQKRKVAENSLKGTSVGSPVTATDYGRDGVTQEPLIYELYNRDGTADGDATPFTIDNNGQITTAVAADMLNFEAPTDDYAVDNDTEADDSVYEVRVKAIDPSMASTTIDVTIRVTDVDEAPNLGMTTETEGLTAVELDENSATSTGLSVYRATDDEDNNRRLKWSLEGPDADKFELSATTTTANCLDPAGTDEPELNANCIELNFKESPDFEARADAGGDNVYNVTVMVTDRDEMTASRAIEVTVKNIEEMGTVTLSNRVPEVGTAITASLTDPDGGIQGLTWKWYRSIQPDETSLVVIPNVTTDSYTPVESDATQGSEQYLYAKATYTDNFRKEDDPGTVNVDESREKDTKTGRSELKTQAMDDTNQPPVFPDQNKGQTRRVQEESMAGDPVGPRIFAEDDDPLTYTLGGSDSSLFEIETSDDLSTTSDDVYHSAQISVAKGTELDYDDGRRNYTVTVTATDPSDASATITVTIEVAPKNEDPVITRRDVGVSGPRSVRHRENDNSDVATYNATGLEGAVTWSLEGDDASDFSISSDGVLSFNSTPNFEAPADADTDNQYNVTVKASAGGVGTTLAVTVSVTNVDEPGTVSISSPGNEVKVGVQLTAELDEGDEETNVTWQWASGPSVTGPWTNISGATDNTYTPVEVDVGNYLRVTVSYTDATFGSDSLPAVAGTAVEAATVTVPGTDGTLALSLSQPIIGESISATLTDADNPVATSYSWQWERSTNNSSWSTVSGATGATYTVGTADAGNYLRATLTYTDDSGTGQTATAATTRQVPVDAVYDANYDGTIDAPEVLTAVRHYFDGDITATRVLGVVKLYFDGL